MYVDIHNQKYELPLYKTVFVIKLLLILLLLSCYFWLAPEPFPQYVISFGRDKLQWGDAVGVTVIYIQPRRTAE
jgi:hypothetical protein